MYTYIGHWTCAQRLWSYTADVVLLSRKLKNTAPQLLFTNRETCRTLFAQSYAFTGTLISKQNIMRSNGLRSSKILTSWG